MPDALNYRAQDSWEPLLAIADLAGGPWPKQAREAALALSGAVDVEGEGVQLLADIRAVLNGSDLKDSDRISSDDLTTRLVALEERPWSEHSRGKPLTKTSPTCCAPSRLCRDRFGSRTAQRQKGISSIISPTPSNVTYHL
jgi:hypothetical protein